MKRAIIAICVLLIITLGLLVYVKYTSAPTYDTTTPIQESQPALPKEQWRDHLLVTFLDIGQGDATLLEFPDGTQMLVDCAKDAVVLEALGRVLPFHDNQIDILLVTHPDLDHYGGCSDVLQNYRIGEIITSGLEKRGDEMYGAFTSYMKQENAQEVLITAPQILTIASTTIQFLYPDHPLDAIGRIPGINKDTGSNNASIVIKVSYGDMDLILTGDAEAELEQYLLKTYPSSTLDVEVYKAGHHGSAGSSIQPFVDALSPLHTVFSAGKGNSYGHPSLRVIRRVERVGSEVWRTDTQGDIQMRVYRDSIKVEEVMK